MKLNKKLRVMIAGVVVIGIAGSAIGYHVVTSGESLDGNGYQEVAVEKGDVALSFSEDGTTQISTTSQMPEFQVNAVTMTVEEVYAAAGDTVSAGDALFKLTDESIEDAKAYYEDAIDDAKKAVTSAEADLATGKLEAQSTLQDTQLNAENAEAIYKAANDEVQVNVENKKEAYDEAVSTIQEYQANLDDGVYYTQGGLGEKSDAVKAAQSTAEQASAALAEAESANETAKAAVAEDLESALSQSKSAASASDVTAAVQQAISDYTTQQKAANVLTEAQKAADTAQSALELAQQKLDSAATDYDKNVEEANTKITELTDSLDELKADYEKAERDAVTEQAEIQNTYDTAVLEGQYAQTTYDATVSTLEAAVTAAQDTLEDLTEEQTVLLAMENGVVTAATDGTLASITYEAENVLISDVAFAAYYDTDTIMISVEVSQEQIAQVSVGDEVSVTISGNRQGAVTGEVSSIASAATTGGSISNVTYAVIISIDNTEGTLSSGSSATVTFTYGTVEEALYLPIDAVSGISGSTGTVLQYDENGEAKKVSVTIGKSSDTYVVITDGLKEGDTCLVETGGTK